MLTVKEKKSSRQKAFFVDEDRDAMYRFYESVEKRVSESALLKRMQKLIEEDPDFYDSYITASEILYGQKKNDQADALMREGYERAVARISDAKGRWPKEILWGYLENRHLMRMIEEYATNVGLMAR